MEHPRNEGSEGALSLSQNFLGEVGPASAYGRLVAEIFGSAPARSLAPDPPWTVLAYFTSDGTCVAGIEIGELALVLDGVVGSAMAIRLAGVAPAHRGRGLFRDLMERALRNGDNSGDALPTLLYTENEALYASFGFVPLVQHAFVGAPPAAARVAPARVVERGEAETLIDRLAPMREPVSHLCAVRSARDLLKANLDDSDLRMAYIENRDALIVYEDNEADLVVVDLVASTVPTMAEIVGALGSGARCVRTLFPPDRLAWDATPDRDDTGLMIRGRVPAAMRRPFMLPPTTSF